MDSDIEFSYSKTGDNQNKYHIFRKSELISLCGKVKNVATLSKKPNDDDICLDCYGAQIDMEEMDSGANPLDAVFMSSRGDNINFSDVVKNTDTDNKDADVDMGFPDLIELQRKQELEHEQEINRGDVVSMAYNKQKDDTDARRTDILVRSLQIKIDKKKRILKRSDISKTQQVELQQSLDNAVAAKTAAESEIVRRGKIPPKHKPVGNRIIKTRVITKVIKGPKEISSTVLNTKEEPPVAKPLVKPRVIRTKKIRGMQPVSVSPPHPGYKPNLTIGQQISTRASTPQYGSNITHIVNKSSCTAQWVEQGQIATKVYKYSMNSGRKRAIDRMRREYPLSHS